MRFTPLAYLKAVWMVNSMSRAGTRGNVAEPKDPTPKSLHNAYL